MSQVHDPFAHALPMSASCQIPDVASFIQSFVCKLSVSLVQDLPDHLKAQRPQSPWRLPSTETRSATPAPDWAVHGEAPRGSETSSSTCTVALSPHQCEYSPSAASIPSSSLSLRFRESSGWAEVGESSDQLLLLFRRNRHPRHQCKG